VTDGSYTSNFHIDNVRLAPPGFTVTENSAPSTIDTPAEPKGDAPQMAVESKEKRGWQLFLPFVNR
jgi:hypothetical protein